MSYKGFSILYNKCRGWFVRVNVFEEWLACSKEDAMRQVDEHLKRLERRNAA
jgi:hypothetical protein